MTITENRPVQEGRYDVLVNNNGELLIAIKKKEGEPASSRILYDGNEHALFYRNATETIILDYIHPDAKEHLTKASKVIIVEFENDDIIREYEVPVQHVKQVPIAPGTVKDAV